MNERTRELIAIGASVSAHCQPCLMYHVTKARELGITEEEIQAAIATGHLVEKGAMSAMKQVTSQLSAGCDTAGAASPPKECCGA